MIVCVCHRVSDRDIAREARSCSSFEELQDELLVATACGACLDCAQATFSEHRSGPGTTCHVRPAGQSQQGVQAALAASPTIRIVQVPA